MEKLLIQLGFHKNEVAVYLALFDLGKVRAKELIEKTGLHRNLVYTALDTLVDRELVTKTIVSGVAVFVANDPDRLVDEIEQKKTVAEELAEQLKRRKTMDIREVVVSEGVKAVTRANDKILDLAPGETGYVFGATKISQSPELHRHWMQFHRKRVAKGVHMKLLFDRSVNEEELDLRNALPYTEARYMPSIFSMPMWMYLVGDTASFVIAKEDPLIVNLKSQDITDAFKQYFNFLWSQKVSSETGYDAVFRTFYSMLDELNSDDEYFVLGANSGPATPSLHSFYETFHTRRVEKGVTVNMIASKNSFADICNKFDAAGDVERKYSNIKTFPSSVEQPFQINLFRNKANLYVFGDNPTMIQFEDPEVYNGFRSYFDTLWNQESYVITGAEAVRDLWIQTLDAEELCFIGARGYFPDRFPKEFQEVIDEKDRRGADIKWRIISDADVQGHTLSTFPWVETRYVLPNVPSPNVVWLFGSTVAVANWTETDPVVFVSTNPHLVQSYRDYFEAMWQQPELI